jgi:hypothetical protein
VLATLFGDGRDAGEGAVVYGQHDALIEDAAAASAIYRAVAGKGAVGDAQCAKVTDAAAINIVTAAVSNREIALSVAPELTFNT